jgi:hypothetical protein
MQPLCFEVYYNWGVILNVQLSEQPFKGIRGHGSAFLVPNVGAEFHRPPSIQRILEDFLQFLGDAFRRVVASSDNPANTEPGNARGIDGLVEIVGHDEHWAGGAQGLAGRANSALVNNCRPARKEFRETNVSK